MKQVRYLVIKNALADFLRGNPCCHYIPFLWKTPQIDSSKITGVSHQWWNLSAADQPPCTPVSHEFLLDIKEQLIAVFERDVWCRLRVFCIQIIYNDDGFKNRCERLEQTAKMTEQTTNNILIIQCLLHIIVLLVGHALAVVYVIMVSKGQRKRWSCLFKISSSHCEVPESYNKALHS